MTVSLVVAQAAAAAGFLQNAWPQMVWTDLPRGRKPGWEVERWDSPYFVGHFYAAPDPLTLLAWLEERCGYQWRRDAEGWWWIKYDEQHQAETSPRADSPDALLTAILARLAEVGE